MSYTLTTLKSAIQDYTENTETTFTTHLRDFIRSAENRLFKMVDFEYFRKNATSATTSSDPYLSVPTDFLSPISLSITNSSSKEFLLEKDVNFIQEYNPNPSTTGTPKYYSRFDVDNFILAPTPDANYSSEIHYYYRPTSLADSTIVLTVGQTSSFAVDETITGAASGSTATISSKDDSTNKLTIVVPSTAFTNGETVTGGTTSHSSVISAISSDTTTTWLSINAMNAMLYGSLAEAYIYMKGEADMMALYEKRFMEEVSRLKDFAEARENSDSYRQGLPRRPRT
mgnify:CR=1 FL=1|tara:strand:+ start:21 stop:875 length:855 start_codon:yes stop_codon:yes gene_type:complete